jgi:hypothetical protein
MVYSPRRSAKDVRLPGRFDLQHGLKPTRARPKSLIFMASTFAVRFFAIYRRKTGASSPRQAICAVRPAKTAAPLKLLEATHSKFI